MHARAAVIGQPIAHSLSPALHRAAYDVLGLPLDYGRQELAPEQLEDFLAACGAGLPDDGPSPSASGSPGPWVGLSVTMPHKQAVAAAAAARSERVELLGAANTLVWGHPEHGAGQHSAGPWAHNTDVEGIVGALRFAGMRPLRGAGTVGVVGNGGTASAAVLAASLLEAEAVTFFVRSAERAAPLVELAHTCRLRAQVRGLQELASAAPGLAAVVCTLPPRAADPLAEQVAAAHGAGDGAGWPGGDAAATPGGDAAATPGGDAGLAWLPPLLDAAYDPWPSAIATAWQDAGGVVVSGMEMLLYQAVEQVRLFAAAAVDRAADPALRERVVQADWAEVTAVMAAAIGLPPRA